ncbi:MAG: hypothetical protein COX57_03865 [Alphaproteobacteria bacterium CG_4_10_14_0_2_um_filter_63_37]|nr:MAG: hypothetical protein COX57_03865 [Alphaproteobacteria bacterium CG_4_10_14_0_2_um_filter_63_37]
MKSGADMKRIAALSLGLLWVSAQGVWADTSLIVQQGMTLSEVVKQHYGSMRPDLMNKVLAANPQITNPDLIPVGTKIALPDDNGATVADDALAGEGIPGYARVVHLNGRALVKKSGLPLYIPAILEQVLTTGDDLWVLNAAETTLGLESGDLVRVSGEAKFKVSSLENQNGGVQGVLDLVKGKFWGALHNLRGQGGSMKFQTHAATAAVRGTKLSLNVEDDATTIKVIEGMVDVQVPGAPQPVSLAKGQQLSLKKDQPAPTTPEPLKLEPWEQENLRLDFQAADTTPPVITLTGPADNTLTNGKSVRIQGSTEAGATATLNGRPLTLGAQGIFDIETELTQEGANLFVITAKDGAGNLSEKRVSVVRDTVAPELALDELGDAVTRSPIVEIRVRTETGAQIKVNDSPAWETAVGGIFSGFVGLTPGPNTITVTAKDAAGNTASRSIAANWDNIPPTLTLNAIPTVTNQKRIEVSGNADPDAVVVVNDKQVTVEGGSFKFPVILTEGPNLINVIAADAAGNIKRQIANVMEDTVPPYLILEGDFAIPSVLTRQKSLTLNGTTEPGGSVTVNGKGIAVQPNGQFSTTIEVGTQSQVLRIETVDAAGNRSGTIRTIRPIGK